MNSICDTYRGRINIVDLYDKPLQFVHTLYKMAFDKNKAEAMAKAEADKDPNLKKQYDAQQQSRALEEIAHTLEGE